MEAGNYTILARLGEGPLGTIYEGAHKRQRVDNVVVAATVRQQPPGPNDGRWDERNQEVNDPPQGVGTRGPLSGRTSAYTVSGPSGATPHPARKT